MAYCGFKAAKHYGYEVVPVPECFLLLDKVIREHAAEQHVVFLWTLEQFLREAEGEMLERGYRLHARFIWDKGNGIAVSLTVRRCHEYLLWWYKPKFLPVAESARDGSERSLGMALRRGGSRSVMFIAGNRMLPTG